jgi:Flp pilus assembly protein TadG
VTLHKPRFRADSGQALLEFVLIIPVLLLFITAIVQFGGIYNHYETITDATRAGARMAAVSRSASDPVATAIQAVRDSAGDLDQAQLSVSVTPAPPWTSGQQITVTASYPYAINLVGVEVKTGNLTSTTKERVE